MPEFSVVVPVYNVEKYVGRCIESILEQTFTDFELILIDDGSSDKSGQICDQYALLDERIYVVHQENGGVSKARNTGILRAQGEFVVFVDSDDTVENNYLSCMAEVDKDIDLVVCGIKNISPDGESSIKLQYENKTIKLLKRDSILEAIENRAIDFVYAKRYKRNLIEKKKICFDEQMNLGEDTVFVTQYLTICESIQYKASILYRYYISSGESLGSFNKNFVERLEEANMKAENILATAFDHMVETREWKERRFSVYYYAIFYTLKNKKYNKKEKYYILKRVCKMKIFGEFAKELDVYMRKDDKKLRRIIATKKPRVIILFWELLEFKTKIKTFWVIKNKIGQL